jgi:hypothetical protein
MEDLEKQLKASLGKLLAPLRKEHDKAVRLHAEHKLKAEQYYAQSRSIGAKIREIEKAVGIKTWTQRKMAKFEERSDVTPKG